MCCYVCRILLISANKDYVYHSQVISYKSCNASRFIAHIVGTHMRIIKSIYNLLYYVIISLKAAGKSRGKYSALTCCA